MLLACVVAGGLSGSVSSFWQFSRFSLIGTKLTEVVLASKSHRSYQKVKGAHRSQPAVGARGKMETVISFVVFLPELIRAHLLPPMTVVSL